MGYESRAPDTKREDNEGLVLRGATNRILEAFVALGVFGLVALALTSFVGFEEPSDTLLMLSSALIFLAPLGLLAHLALTKELTRGDKRLWLRELTSRRGAAALADYLNSNDRRAAIRQRVEAAADAVNLTSGEPPAAR